LRSSRDRAGLDFRDTRWGTTRWGTTRRRTTHRGTTGHERVRSLQDSQDRCPFQRINGERCTRRQGLVTVYHHLNEHHYAVVATLPEATHILEHQSYFPSAPLHERTNGVQGRFR
jgi:hypothetical protein